jgi:hypothetical protein
VSSPAKVLPVRIVLALVGFAALAGPVGLVLGEAVDKGDAGVGAFGFLVILCGLLLRALAIHVEGAVLGIRQRPWLQGRLMRWQRLILPFSSATVLGYGFTCAFGGTTYLLTAPPGWTPLNVTALGFNAVGGLLLGFGLARLVGLFIVRYSGLWAASKRAWVLGGVVVATCSLAYSAHCVVSTLRIVSGQ